MEIKLNKEQLEAVRHGRGPLLIIAGAGTGKTTVVTERIKWLISKDLAKPSEILALTFTEKAAGEMEERVDVAMPYGYTQMWISTFHAFCDRVLRAEAIHVGLTPAYKLMTEAETIIFLHNNLFKFKLSYFRPLGNPTKFLGGMLQHFSRLKDEDVSVEEYLKYARKQKIDKKVTKEEKEKTLELAQAYKVYEELKIKEGVVDFSDLITNTLKLFRIRPNILREYQRQFKHVLVDEFQDTNFAQYMLIKILTPPEEKPNLTVVCDDSQSIFRFRGAAVSNILQFMKDYKKAGQVVLTKNYRSTQTILDDAHRLIKNNDPDTLEAKLGISKNLKKMREVDEEKVEFLRTERVENEAEQVAEKINELSKKGYQWSDFAILLRANSHADPFVRALARKGIPYQFLGPGMLLNQPEVKDLIAYFKLLYNLEDSVAAFRILSTDLLGINPRDLATLTSFAKKGNLSLFESCEMAVGLESGERQTVRPVTSRETKEKLEKFVKMVHRHLKYLSKETAGQILYYFLEDTGLLHKMTNYQTVAEEEEASNIAKFFDKLKTYEVDHDDASVAAVVDWIEMSLELGESPLASNTDWNRINAVNLLTVHSSKGLEFPVVFLVNLVSQRFPTSQRREQVPIPEALIKEILPEGDFHLEEERRLFYVGMTRARDRLFLTAADYYGEGKRVKKISPFVAEALGEEILKVPIVETGNQLGLLEWQKGSEEEKTQKMEKREKEEKIIYLSYSQIETFKTCPFHYKIKYILKVPAPVSSAQSFGTSLHATLRDFYQEKIDGKNPREKDILKIFKKNWINEGYKDRRHEELTFKKGEKFLRSFWRQVKGSQVLPLTLEQPFIFPLGKNVRVVGKLDRVDPTKEGGIEIIDYKSGARVPSQKDIDRDLQMTIYALAATQVQEAPFGKNPEEILLSFYFFETGEKITTKRTAKQLEEAKEEILSWAQKINHSDFECGASRLCDWCEYQLLCERG